MKICGIIAEYNPFHSGHAHHIRETKKLLGENTAIVCVMSGNYVQRGDAAIMEKYQRARAAARRISSSAGVKVFFSFSCIETTSLSNKIKMTAAKIRRSLQFTLA